MAGSLSLVIRLGKCLGPAHRWPRWPVDWSNSTRSCELRSRTAPTTTTTTRRRGCSCRTGPVGQRCSAPAPRPRSGGRHGHGEADAGRSAAGRAARWFAGDGAPPPAPAVSPTRPERSGHAWPLPCRSCWRYRRWRGQPGAAHLRRANLRSPPQAALRKPTQQPPTRAADQAGALAGPARAERRGPAREPVASGLSAEGGAALLARSAAAMTPRPRSRPRSEAGRLWNGQIVRLLTIRSGSVRPSAPANRAAGGRRCRQSRPHLRFGDRRIHVVCRPFLVFGRLSVSRRRYCIP